MLITTSAFTREAAVIAAAHNVELIDGTALVGMARRASERTGLPLSASA
jgi:restriction endonuclease Mrr